MKAHCPVSPPPPPRRQGKGRREGGEAVSELRGHMAPLWIPTTCRCRRPAAGRPRGAVEKTPSGTAAASAVVLWCMLMSEGVAHLRVHFASDRDHRSTDYSLFVIWSDMKVALPRERAREAVCR